MLIRYQRSGGLANIPLSLDIDSEKLPEHKAKEIHRLIEEARLFDQPAKANVSKDAPDQFQYELTLEEGNRKHTIQTSDTAATNELLTLFDLLNDEALADLKKKAKKP